MDSDYINRNVIDLFSKKFCLSDKYTYKIKTDDLFKSDPWKIEELQEIKDDLNRVKEKLNHYNLLKWHNHTRLTNRAGEVIRYLKKLNPELLTQAWCKFYEILCVFCLIPQFAEKNGIFNSFHLCEAPGAFVTSLNHFLKLQHHGLKWNWLASTLNPYFEGNEFIYMINDDRFIIHTLEKWCFGADFTGNIKKKENLIDLLEKAELIKPVHLVTADGSVDCQTDPAEQEALVASLHYCETAVALNILAKGGNFVLKIFTIFECQTVCLLYILRCSFNSIHIIKPVCSKEGNSEVYVVCLDFIGKDHVYPLLSILISNYDRLTEPKVIFSLSDIPSSFINLIIECCKFFKFQQVSAIERNIRLYENKVSKKQKMILKRIRFSVAKKFMITYNILPLYPEQYVVQSYMYKSSLTYSPKDENYSFAEKALAPTLDLEAVLRGLKSKLNDITVTWMGPDVQWVDGFLSQEAGCDISVSIKTGRVIDYISSSVFCMRILLEIRNTLENEINLNDISSYHNFKDFDLRFLIDVHLDGHIINFNDSLNSWMKNNNDIKLGTIQCILKVLNDMKYGETLIIKNFPLLTQFNVGVIFILGQLFDNIGFANPTYYGYTIIFQKLEKLTGNLLFRQIEENLLTLQGTSTTIITLVSIKELYSEEFYKCITTINHIVLQLSSLYLINSLLKQQ